MHRSKKRPYSIISLAATRRSGGTKHHAELWARFGLDARDPKFWDGRLSVIAKLIDELALEVR